MTLRLKITFKIKFDSKQNPLGMPAHAKKWTLLANHNDKILLRNKIVFK